MHLALETQNTRIVNLILQYMSKVKQTGFEFDKIKSIFPDLINYKRFVGYLMNTTF